MMNKRLRAFLPVLLAVILLLPAHALAADRIDPEREIKLIVSARDGETPLCGEQCDIYLVADVLGHKDVNTTRKHYAAQQEENRRRAAKAVKLREP